MADRELITTEKVTGPDGKEVRIRFYDDRAMRFEVVEAGPMHIFEAFLPGRDRTVIIGLTPRPRQATNE